MIVFIENTDTDSSNVSYDNSFREQLASWAVNNNITLTCLNQLLVLLKNNGHKTLPSDARTLLQTPKKTDIISVGNGEYCHFGLEKSIQNQLTYLMNLDNSTNELEIDISIDGIPISKSSNVGFWPILGSFRGCQPKMQPFLIGIFYGATKPASCKDFLAKFVEEYKNISRNHINIGDKSLVLKIRAFICDAPATAFIKGIKGHTGYFSCGKCTTEGSFINNRMCFPEIDCQLRTDDDFKNRLQPEHHIVESLLEDIDIKMVSQFPLDYLHLVCLGRVKKLIDLWLHGPLTVRLTKFNIQQINESLYIAEKSRPTEINRLIRKIDQYKMWKGTEFRTFLLYTGPVILKNIVKCEVYENFMLLSCAIRILCDTNKCQNLIDLTSKMLSEFVLSFNRVYGTCYISYNVHNLIHLSNDAAKFGTLDNFSAFTFESHMFQIKRLIRKGNFQLQQVINRVTEKYLNDSVIYVNPDINYPKFSKKLKGSENKYSKLILHTFTLQNNNRNKWFLHNETKEIYMFISAIRVNESEAKIECKKITNIENFFVEPLNSTYIEIFYSKNGNNMYETELSSINLNISKLFVIDNLNNDNDVDDSDSVECDERGDECFSKVFLRLIHT